MTEIKEIKGFTKDTVYEINKRPVAEFLEQELKNSIAEYLNLLQDCDVNNDDEAREVERMERTIKTMALTSLALSSRALSEEAENISTHLYEISKR